MSSCNTACAKIRKTKSGELRHAYALLAAANPELKDDTALRVRLWRQAGFGGESNDESVRRASLAALKKPALMTVIQHHRPDMLRAQDPEPIEQPPESPENQEYRSGLARELIHRLDEIKGLSTLVNTGNPEADGKQTKKNRAKMNVLAAGYMEWTREKLPPALEGDQGLCGPPCFGLSERKFDIHLLLLARVSATEAYARTANGSSPSRSTCQKKGPEIAKGDDVQAAITWHRQLRTGAVLSKAAKLEEKYWSYMDDSRPEATRDRIAAGKEIANLNGLNAPERIQLDQISWLSDVLRNAAKTADFVQANGSPSAAEVEELHGILRAVGAHVRAQSGLPAELGQKVIELTVETSSSDA